MTSRTKQKTLFFIGLVMIIMMMVAASLPRLDLQPGMPLPRLNDNRGTIVSIEENSFVAISVNKFILIFFALIAAGSMLYVLFKSVKGADWKILLTFIPSTMLIGLIIVGIIFFIMLLPTTGVVIPEEMPLPTATPPVASTLNPVPPLLIWLVGIVLLAITLLVGVWIFFSTSRQPSTIDVVGLEAEKAWQALKTGLDLKDVIVKCYRQMSLALEKEQGIEREVFMTTREFENRLDAAGVPHAPIHQLTQLFEAVRYGNWRPNQEDEQKAICCLEAIVLYSCQGRKAE